VTGYSSRSLRVLRRSAVINPASEVWSDSPRGRLLLRVLLRLRHVLIRLSGGNESRANRPGERLFRVIAQVMRDHPVAAGHGEEPLAQWTDEFHSSSRLGTLLLPLQTSAHRNTR